MNKQQVIAFMDWVEAAIDLKIELYFRETVDMNKTISALKLTEEAANRAITTLEYLKTIGVHSDSIDPTIRAEKKALAAIREALADHIPDATKMVGCAYCDNPLFAGTKCNNCGRVTLAEPVKQEPVAWKETVRALTDQVAALVWERDELQKQVQRYERNGVTCQLYGHKVERSCAECNEDQLYVAPVSAEAIRAEALEEAAAMGEESIRIWGDQDGRMVEVVAAIRRLK